MQTNKKVVNNENSNVYLSNPADLFDVKVYSVFLEMVKNHFKLEGKNVSLIFVSQQLQRGSSVELNQECTLLCLTSSHVLEL